MEYVEEELYAIKYIVTKYQDELIRKALDETEDLLKTEDLLQKGADINQDIIEELQILKELLNKTELMLK